ncbi:hypothetical protein ACFL52_05070, partial [Candidatus Margulisiibacteriota bacterium]
ISDLYISTVFNEPWKLVEKKGGNGGAYELAAKDAVEMASDRPVLITVNDYSDLVGVQKAIEEALKKYPNKKVNVQVLDASHSDKKRDAIIEKAGKAGVITISTRIGRGTNTQAEKAALEEASRQEERRRTATAEESAKVDAALEKIEPASDVLVERMNLVTKGLHVIDINPPNVGENEQRLGRGPRMHRPASGKTFVTKDSEVLQCLNQGDLKELTSLVTNHQQAEFHIEDKDSRVAELVKKGYTEKYTRDFRNIHRQFTIGDHKYLPMQEFYSLYENINSGNKFIERVFDRAVSLIFEGFTEGQQLTAKDIDYIANKLNQLIGGEKLDKRVNLDDLKPKDGKHISNNSNLRGLIAQALFKKFSLSFQGRAFDRARTDYNPEHSYQVMQLRDKLWMRWGKFLEEAHEIANNNVKNHADWEASFSQKARDAYNRLMGGICEDVFGWAFPRRIKRFVHMAKNVPFDVYRAVKGGGYGLTITREALTRYTGDKKAEVENTATRGMAEVDKKVVEKMEAAPEISKEDVKALEKGGIVVREGKVFIQDGNIRLVYNFGDIEVKAFNLMDQVKVGERYFTVQQFREEFANLREVRNRDFLSRSFEGKEVRAEIYHKNSETGVYERSFVSLHGGIALVQPIPNVAQKLVMRVVESSEVQSAVVRSKPVDLKADQIFATQKANVDLSGIKTEWFVEIRKGNEAMARLLNMNGNNAEAAKKINDAFRTKNWEGVASDPALIEAINAGNKAFTGLAETLVKNNPHVDEGIAANMITDRFHHYRADQALPKNIEIDTYQAPQSEYAFEFEVHGTKLSINVSRETLLALSRDSLSSEYNIALKELKEKVSGAIDKNIATAEPKVAEQLRNKKGEIADGLSTQVLDKAEAFKNYNAADLFRALQVKYKEKIVAEEKAKGAGWEERAQKRIGAFNESNQLRERAIEVIRLSTGEVFTREQLLATEKTQRLVENLYNQMLGEKMIKEIGTVATREQVEYLRKTYNLNSKMLTTPLIGLRIKSKVGRVINKIKTHPQFSAANPYAAGRDALLGAIAEPIVTMLLGKANTLPEVAASSATGFVHWGMFGAKRAVVCYTTGITDQGKAIHRVMAIDTATSIALAQPGQEGYAALSSILSLGALLGTMESAKSIDMLLTSMSRNPAQTKAFQYITSRFRFGQSHLPLILGMMASSVVGHLTQEVWKKDLEGTAIGNAITAFGKGAQPIARFFTPFTTAIGELGIVQQGGIAGQALGF